MLITALVAGISLLSLRGSVMLVELLTVGLLPLAIWMIRRWPAFALMTLSVLGMLWRGEAWKAAYQTVAEQLSQLPPQCLQSSPKSTYFYLSPGMFRTDPHRLIPSASLNICRNDGHQGNRERKVGIAEERLGTSPSLGEVNLSPSSDRFLCQLEVGLLLSNPQTGTTSDLLSNYHTQLTPTPSASSFASRSLASRSCLFRSSEPRRSSPLARSESVAFSTCSRAF